ncbi:MAG TPA: c-type cytochrome [Burkholderiales bacterium]|jgi:cytochrome c553|nr:c-type cytochrome [Burkholderiales bacterium]
MTNECFLRRGPLPIRTVAALLFGVLLIAGTIDVSNGTEMPGYRGDPKKGLAKSAACVSCHEGHGRSTGTSLFPRIGGQNFEYIYRSLREYRDGQRRMGWAPAMMNDAVKGFSDDDLKDIARHFHSMRW